MPRCQKREPAGVRAHLLEELVRIRTGYIRSARGRRLGAVGRFRSRCTTTLRACSRQFRLEVHEPTLERATHGRLTILASGCFALAPCSATETRDEEDTLNLRGDLGLCSRTLWQAAEFIPANLRFAPTRRFIVGTTSLGHIGAQPACARDVARGCRWREMTC